MIFSSIQLIITIHSIYIHTNIYLQHQTISPSLASNKRSIVYPKPPTPQEPLKSLIMVAFTSLAIAATTLIGLTTAIPAQHVRSTGVIHRITAGFNGLHFEPENVSAAVGDIVEFHFMPKNHSVVQSSFDVPCEPLSSTTTTHMSNGIFSGFNFATKDGEAENVFSFIVKDTKPFWYYCSQTVGNHCQMGMSGVINQDFGGEKTLAKYKMAAVNTTTKQPSDDAKASQGGWISPNVAL
jgi:plastocyanin